MSSLLAALKPAKQGLGGGDIVSLTRAATQKTLPAPDAELNADVVDALRKGHASPEATADALRARLRQANPHKVWLAVELTREVLTKAPEATRHVRARVLEDVERVAASPMNRYGSDLKGQQNAKTAAFKLVSEYAGGGLLLPGAGNGDANGGAGNAPVRASGQGKRRKPKPQDGGGGGGDATAAAAAAEGGASSAPAPHVISSRKPQAMRRVTPADRPYDAQQQQQPSCSSPRASASATAASSASPRRDSSNNSNNAAASSSSSSSTTATTAPPAPPAPPRGRWARVLEAAAAGEATGKRYVASMCDALMLYAGACSREGHGSKAASSAEATAASLAREMVQFNGALERVVAQVANGGGGGGGGSGGGSGSSGGNSRKEGGGGGGGGFGGPEAEAVTRRCLATTDAVCAALALHEEVLYARRARQVGAGAGAAAAAAGAATAAGAGAAAAAAVTEEEEDSDGDGDDHELDELASALEAAVVSPKAAAEGGGGTTATTAATTIPRAPSNNPFDDFVVAPAPADAAAAAPAAPPAAAFEDAAVFAAAPTTSTTTATEAAAAAAPAPDFADLLK